MVTSMVEIERKYDVGEGALVPELRTVPGVQEVLRVHETLDATYFDTEDGMLGAAGITLRRRSGGSDAGWHLKLPFGGDREEIRVPGGDLSAGVPVELQSLVRARSRDRALIPVAHLGTTRTVHRLVSGGGQVLADVCDDTVHSRVADREDEPSMSWREWEVELVDGSPDLLEVVQEKLLVAGAAPSSSGSKVSRALGAASGSRVRRPSGKRRPSASSKAWGNKASAGRVVQAHLSEQVEELLARDPHVRRDQPDALHKMRVATRRLRSALRSFRPLLDRSVVDPLRGELQWLAEVLGAVRDTEVMHDRLRQLVAEQPADLVRGPVSVRIDRVLEQRYRQAHDGVLLALESPRYLRLLDALDELTVAPPLLPEAKLRARKVFPQLVSHTWNRLDKAMSAAESETGDQQDLLLHEARKDAKRTRYAAEAVSGVYGKPARAYAKAITTLQEVLGAHQDGVVTRQVLQELAEAAEQAGESAFTYGRLHALEQSRAEAAVAGWRQVHAEAARPRLRRWQRR